MIFFEAVLFLITMVMALFYHEAGHVLGYFIFGKKPDIKFNMLTIEIGKNVISQLKNKEAFVVALMGIILGMLPLIITYESIGEPLFTIGTCLYSVGCWFDYQIIYLGITKPNEMFTGE